MVKGSFDCRLAERVYRRAAGVHSKLYGHGRVDWTCRTGSPTSMVYVDAAKMRTVVVWNPQATPETVTVYENDKPIGQMTATPQALTSTTKLQPVGAR